MQVQFDSWAWVPKKDLGEGRLARLKKALTVQPRKVGDHPGDPPDPIDLYQEHNGHIAVPRQFFFNKMYAPAPHEFEVTYGFTEGNSSVWTPLRFNGVLEPDQERGVSLLVKQLRDGLNGGILQAVPGWGKTVAALAIIARMGVPTLITVHKTFLLRQWQQRIERFLPEARVGIVRQNKCDFKDKHIVIGINTSLSVRDYGEEFYNHFGLIVSDEVHRIGAPTWSKIPTQFGARWRLGLSATPRRSDGATSVFINHIGDIVFVGRVERLDCQVKRVFFSPRIPESFRQNPTLLTTTMATRYLTRNTKRNEIIVQNLIGAAKAGRKILVLSHIREKHIVPLEKLFRDSWPSEAGPCPTTSFYVGGMKDEEFEEAEKAQVIFGTVPMAKEGLDIPPLDTLFLTTPLGNVEQAVGRIQRNYPSKKTPMVVDFRDDTIGVCRRLGELRWKFYKKKGWVSDTGPA